MDTGKAKCPECRLLFETSFDGSIDIKTCSCCGHVGSVTSFVCNEEDWLKRKELKKSFLSSLKKKEDGKENKLKKLKKFRPDGVKIDPDKFI